jgi:site-specific DNA-cytosine methylase
VYNSNRLVSSCFIWCLTVLLFTLETKSTFLFDLEATMASSAPAPAPELEDELAAFRAQWRQEAERKRQLPPAPAASIPVAAASTSKSERHHQPLEAPLELARSPDRAKRVSIDADTDRLAEQIEAVDLEASPRAKDSAAKRADREREHERERERELELRERARPKSALELYEFAVSSEREGRMQDGKLLDSYPSSDWQHAPSWLLIVIPLPSE